MQNSLTQKTLFGEITLVATDDKLTHLYLPNANYSSFSNTTTPLLQTAFAQLNAYFAGEIRVFDLPLLLSGTPFMLDVWRELSNIPYAQTASYHDIAKKINRPRAVRAVGNANHRNPLPIFIPCHRVIGSNGKLSGYGGGVALKQQLLALENRHQ